MTKKHIVVVHILRTDRKGKIVNFDGNKIHCLEWLVDAATPQAAVAKAKQLTADAGYAGGRAYVEPQS